MIHEFTQTDDVYIPQEVVPEPATRAQTVQFINEWIAALETELALSVNEPWPVGIHTQIKTLKTVLTILAKESPQ